MTARIPQHAREEQLNALPNMRFVRWLDGYKNNASRAQMSCDKGHEWSARVANLLNGKRGCPRCSGNHHYSAEERELQLNAISTTARFVKWCDGIYRGAQSKATMMCENGHLWASSVDSLVNQKTGCPVCAKRYRYSATEREAQLEALPGKRFIAWDHEYLDSDSKARMGCELGHIWSASVHNLIDNGRGCPMCSKNRRLSTAEREVQLDDLPGKRFVRWEHGHHRNKNSKAVMQCDVGHQWIASVDNLIRGSGCPACAKTGYDPAKPGTIYALLHENGAHIKIGISNAHSRRLAELRRATPFKFEPISLHHSNDGRVIADLEKVFHQNFESSGFSGFDGATEWLKFNPDILTIMRILGA